MAAAGPTMKLIAYGVATRHSIVPRDCNGAIVLAAFKGGALARRPGGRS